MVCDPAGAGLGRAGHRICRRQRRWNGLACLAKGLLIDRQQYQVCLDADDLHLQPYRGSFRQVETGRDAQLALAGANECMPLAIATGHGATENLSYRPGRAIAPGK